MKTKVFLFILLLMFLPATVIFAAGLVPCGGPPPELACNFDYLLLLVKNIIDFLLFTLAVPLATIMFAYAGWLYLSAGGDEGKIKRAHSIFLSVLVGLVVALGAWLIVNTIAGALLSEEFKQSGVWLRLLGR